MKYELSTSRLILRPLDISDAETVHEYASDDENTTYMYFLPNKTMEEPRSFLEYVTAEWQKDAPATYEFAVVLEGEDLQNSEEIIRNIENRLDQIRADLALKPWERTSAAIGIARNREGDTPDMVFRRADEAMYARKKEMKARFQAFR
jgi:RimJ/RimL family protein N-acetyltransferase